MKALSLLILIIGLNGTKAFAQDAETAYVQNQMEQPIPTGIIVFEQTQGMNRLLSNRTYARNLPKSFISTKYDLHYIGDRPGDLLGFDTDECEFAYIRFFQSRLGSATGTSTNHLTNIYSCEHFIYRVLARVRPGRKLYIKLGRNAKGITIIDKMYFEGQVIFQDGKYIEKSDDRSLAPLHPDASWSEYARELYLHEEWRQRRCN